MAIRLAFPGLTRKTQSTPDVEKRYSTPLGSGYSLGNLGGTVNTALLGTGQSEFNGSEIGYRGIKLKVVNMAGLDLAIETREVDKDDVETFDISKADPICDLWNKDPLSGVNAVLFKRIVFGQFEKAGQAFVWTPRPDPAALPFGLFNTFESVTPVIDNRAPTTYEEQIRMAMFPPIVGYRVVTAQGVFGVLPHEMMWFRDPQYFTMYGAESTWNAASWPTDLDQLAREWQSSEFKNGGHPTGVIYLGDLEDEQAQFVKAQFEQNHTGAANARRHLFIYGKNQSKYERIGTTPAEMSYLESHVQNQKDTLLALGIPVDKMMGETTFDNQAAANIALWTDELNPTLELFEAEIDRHLLPDVSRRAVFDRSKVAALQENVEDVQNRTIAAWEADLLTWQEARSEIGKEALEENDERNLMTITEYRSQFKQSVPAFAPVLEDGQDPDSEDEDGKKPIDKVKDDNDKKPDKDAGNAKTSDVDKADLDEALKDEQGKKAKRLAELTPETRGAETDTGVMVGFWIPQASAEKLAVDGQEPIEDLHCTLAYLGKITDGLDKATILETVHRIAGEFPPLTGSVAGSGVFDIGEEGAVAIGLVDMVGLGELRARLVAELITAGQNVVETHGYQPHISIGYTETVDDARAIPVASGVPLDFSEVTFAWGSEHYAISLTGTSIRTTLKLVGEDGPELVIRKANKAVGYTDSEADRLISRYEKNLKRAVTRLAEKQERIVLRRFKKAHRKGKLATEDRAQEDPIFDEEYWTSETEQVFEDVIDSLYFDVGSRMGGDLGVDFKVIEPYMVQAIHEQVANSALEVTQTTRDKIAKILVEGIEDGLTVDEIADDLSGTFTMLGDSRALLIARTEIRTAYNKASVITASESGFAKNKIWATSAESCDECKPSDGDKVSLKKLFKNGVQTPPLHPACTCRLQFEIDIKATEGRTHARSEETT